MNSSIEIDKIKYFLGYHYGVAEVLSLNMAPQPGMFFINGETNSVWVWDALCREWIDTNRIDSGLKGMLTDKEGNSPSDFIPSPQVGVKESYFYVAKTDTPQQVTFTHFKNGNNSVSVVVPNTSVVILYWNGDYWEVSLIPMNINLSELAKADELKSEIERSSQKDAIFDSYINGVDKTFATTFEVTYEGKILPYLIPKGSVIYLSGDITEILAYTTNNDSTYTILKNGDTTDRDITYIKNSVELGDLTIEFSYIGIASQLADMGCELKNIELSLNDIEKIVEGGVKHYGFELIKSPAYLDKEERLTGYFQGYKVDLTQFVGSYDEVCFRGAEWDYPSNDSHITRGIILDTEGNVESVVPYVADKSNGWQSLPITPNSKTLWATYCTKPEGGEVWTPEYVILKKEDDEAILDKIEKIDNSTAVILPSDIYLLKGRTSQLFYRGFIKAVNPYDYDIKVKCDVGKTFPRYYEIDGETPVGDYPITFQVRNSNLKVLGEATALIHIVEEQQISTQTNILCVGDSTAVTGCWAAELNRMINNPLINFVGRKEGTIENIKLEATGGWSWGSFIASDAPFPKGSFIGYANTYCGGKIDVMIVHLGVNNSLWENSNPETAISDARTLIEGYFADFPEGKMIIAAIPMPDEGTNVYENRNSENNINRYGAVSSFLRYNKDLYNLVEELKSVYNISYVPTNILFDTDYAYPKEYKGVNTRMDMFKEMVGVNGVHPTPEGSYMVSDAILPMFYEKIVK